MRLFARDGKKGSLRTTSMSEMDQKRRFGLQPVTSGLPPTSETPCASQTVARGQGTKSLRSSPLRPS